MTTTLYKTDANDQIRVWSILAENNVIIMQHGILNGAMQVVTDVVDVNQSGRHIDEQVALEIRSRINKQLDKGYCPTVGEAIASKGLNASKLLKPMLAQKFKDVKNIDYEKCFLQYKYNGHRCLVTNKNHKLTSYSRNGKPILSINHILKELSWLLPGYTLDGELYHHGTALQTIGSWVRKNQTESQKLVYVVYDVIVPNSDISYTARIAWLRKNGSSQSVIIAPTTKFVKGMNIKDMLTDSISKGYEGLILRHGDTPYEPGKRSSSLVKVKQVLDEEFCIVSVHQSSDGWAIFECCKKPGIYVPLTWSLEPQNVFRVSAPGTMQDKHDAWTNRNDFIGKMLTVEFFEWTNDGKPFHPVAIGIRGVE